MPNLEENSLVFDASVLQHQFNIPPQFIWPDHERPCSDTPPALYVPTVDLARFLSGDFSAIRDVDQACRQHGVFLVVNHGVDLKLVEEAHKGMDYFFGKPMDEKQKAQRKVGEHCGNLEKLGDDKMLDHSNCRHFPHRLPPTSLNEANIALPPSNREAIYSADDLEGLERASATIPRSIHYSTSTVREVKTQTPDELQGKAV